MSWEAARRVRYAEFENSVRQYDPTHLLPIMARQSAQMTEFEGFQQAWKNLAPWTISGIARASIETSRQHREKPITAEKCRRLAFLFEQVEVVARDRFELIPFLLGKAHEQSPYQVSAKEDLTRTLSLLLDTEIPQYKNAKSDGDWAEVLGAPLIDAGRAAMALYAIVREQGGIFHREAMVQKYWEPVKYFVPPTTLFATLDRLTATVEEARLDALAAPQLVDGLRKYGYNPLIKTPFIQLGDGLVCAPQNQFVLRTFTPDSLFYLGAKTWKDFPTEFGYRVEAYTGAQLQHTGELEVLPEIRWGKKNGNLSVDWFLITPAATILIECKSARMTLSARAGDTTSVTTISQKLSIAYDQLNTTVEEIRSGSSAFAQIPKDRPFIGLVVTAEHCYLANTGAIRAYLPKTELPVLTISLRELEHLAPLPAEVIGQALLAITQDPQLYESDLHNSLGPALGGVDITQTRNQLADDAYVKYMMSEPGESQARRSAWG